MSVALWLVAVSLCGGPTLVAKAGQVVVASVVATDAPYGADASGQRDAGPAIQQAIDAVAAARGGVVYLPAGRYRLEAPLRLAWGVTLCGEPVPEAAVMATPSATWLLAACGRGDENGPPLLTLPWESGLLNVTLAWPEQRPEQIVPYPFAVGGGCATISGVTLVNAHNGVELDDVNGCVVENVHGTALRRGIVAPHSAEFAWMHDVRFDNATWAALAPSLSGAPLSAAQRAALDSFTHARLVGLELGRLDALAIQRFAAPDAALPVLMKKGDKERPERVFGFGGVVAEFPARRDEIDPWYYGMHYANLDQVPEARGHTYTFARTPTAARLGPDDLHVVSAPDDGQGDAAPAIQQALDAAGRRGGGVVYLPPGEYAVHAPLRVPTGVELRGPVGRGFVRQHREVCTLAIYAGAAPEAAAVTLAAGAGVRGLTLWYPEQGQDAASLRPYPPSIRGAGAAVWAIDLVLLNAWDGIDLGTQRCDRHLVRGVWGTCFRQGVVVGGGSRDGRLERLALSYGPWLEAGRLYDRGQPRLSAEARAGVVRDWETHAVNYTFGACSGERAWGLVGFAPLVHLRLRDDGAAGCARDAECWLSMFDVASGAVVQAEQGEQVSFYGIFATGGTKGPGLQGNWIEPAPGFRGPLTVLAPTVQPPFIHHPLPAGAERLRWATETLRSTACPAASGPDPAACLRPEAAVDRDPRSYWEGPPGSWLQVDLGAVVALDRWGFESAWAECQRDTWTRECELQVSDDGRTFNPAARLNANGAAWADAPLTPPVRARYVRLRPLGEAPARIAEFRVGEVNH